MAYMTFFALKFALLLLMNGRTGVSFMDTHLRQHFLILFLSGVHGPAEDTTIVRASKPLSLGVFR